MKSRMLMGYEVTRDLPLEDMEIETPLCKMTGKVISGKKLAVVPILRAGLGMVDGLLELVPVAKVGHIGLYRDPETHLPIEYYCKLPMDISERIVIVVDPMLATGGSACDALTKLKERGCTHLRLMCLVAAPEGVAAVQKAHPDVDIYVAAVDEKLNEHAYIVPGLGDAGGSLVWNEIKETTDADTCVVLRILFFGSKVRKYSKSLLTNGENCIILSL